MAKWVVFVMSLIFVVFWEFELMLIIIIAIVENKKAHLWDDNIGGVIDKANNSCILIPFNVCLKNI